ncbi:MAG TPA: nuclear transport factor 2 family protein [Acidimicrobiales bacterium]
MIDLPAVQGLLASWWFAYDRGDFDAWPDHFTADAHFSCRSDSGETAFEEFIRADVRGRDEVVAWQVEHRRNSPYPLRHMATNVHLTATRAAEVDFASYLFVTQILGQAVSNVSSGVVLGTVRDDEGVPRIADLRVVLDFTDSVAFTDATRHEPA